MRLLFFQAAERSRAQISRMPSRSCSIDDLVGFFRSGSSIFVACIVVSLLIKVSQLFYEYGTMLLPREALSSSRLLLPVIQSFIPVAVCLFTTWYLACSREGAPRTAPLLCRHFARDCGYGGISLSFMT